MTSHGVPRIHTSTDRSEEARQQELKEIEKYTDLVDEVEIAVASNEYTTDSLALTSKLLKTNPEYYTAWNHRRRILTELLSSQPETTDTSVEDHVRSMISADLEFLLPLLMNFPKCYWIWNHRRWLLQQASQRLSPDVARDFWQHELVLVGKMLLRDSRNFHGWNYRRIVVSQLDKLEAQSNNTSESADSASSTLTEQEFAYTTKMIHSNLSNFSAWHNRSKLIPRLLDERRASDGARRKLYEQELDLIQNAIATDPYDQSLWFYHQYLVSTLQPSSPYSFVAFTNHDRLNYLEKQIDFIREILEDTDDCKWIYQHLLLYVNQYLEVDGGNAFVTTAEMRAWLQQLKKLDPLRLGRWNDLERQLGL